MKTNLQIIITCMFIAIGFQLYTQNRASDLSSVLENGFEKLENEYIERNLEFLTAEERQKSNIQPTHIGLVMSDLEQKMHHLKRLQSAYRDSDSVYWHDTLVIGISPGEEIIIDSIWIQNGPIIVLGDGILRFKSAAATILGDIYTMENAQILADSSTLYFPQEYFYQRGIMLTGNSSIKIKNSTIDFGGLVHSIATVNNAYLELINVEKDDFSTVGLYSSSSIFIDDISVAGEFIVTDSSNLQISNAKTVLLWHHFGSGSQAEIIFPDGESVNHFELDNTSPGISGINYSIEIDTCAEVMWGLMPSNGSDITISDSEIRSIGLWFEGNDSTMVSGLVNNSFYHDFTPNLNDRNLHLIDCDVMTWSLYSFDNVVVDVKSCILGEIGVMGNSVVNATNYYLDGSGGYLFATDTTFLLAGFSSLTSALRSSKNSIVIFAYSTMMNGLVQALENSILMLIQSNISAEPELGNGAVIWMAKIEGPPSGYENSIIDIEGSAWIDKGYFSYWMDFDHFTLHYQKNGDSTWNLIEGAHYEEIREDVLVSWNTAGLWPGVYLLKMELTDNMNNSAVALKDIVLLPGIVGVDQTNLVKDELFIFPNPASHTISVNWESIENGEVTLAIYDNLGNEIEEIFTDFISTGKHSLSFDINSLCSGIYFLHLKRNGAIKVKKFVVL